jgi:probable rRNA maturation factor
MSVRLLPFSFRRERKLITIEKEVEGIKESSLKRFMRKAQRAVGLKGEVSVLLTSNRQMRELNRCFRGKDKSTDVISFPAADVVSHKIAGDLAISVDIAAANAKNFGHTTDEEVRVLILHGLLHLAGYDHETDKGEMARKEESLREMLGLPSNLIARTEGSLNQTRPSAKARSAR